MTDFKETPLIATFASEHSQFTSLPYRIDTVLIAPLQKFRDALNINVDMLGKVVAQHTELAAMLYNETIADGRITVGSQAFTVSKEHVHKMAEARTKELADRIAKMIDNMLVFKETIDDLEKELTEVLKRVSVSGKPLA